MSEITLSYPKWYDPSSQSINDAGLADAIIAELELQKDGRSIIGQTGALVMPETIKRKISDAISPYVKTGLSRYTKSIFETLTIRLPVGNAPPFRTYTVFELVQKNPQPPKPIIDNLLYPGLGGFAGAPKVGKSWFGLAVAEAISNGTKFFGFDTVQGDVLYMALEDSESRLLGRIEAMGLKKNEHFHYVINGARTLDNGLIQQLEAWADSVQMAKLIIIDTIARVKGGRKRGLDSYEGDSAIYAPLQEFAMKRGLAVMCITHYRKESGRSASSDPYERITGSNGLFSIADIMWLVYGERGKEQTFRVIGREVDEQEYKIERSGCRWQMLGESEALEKQRKYDAYRQDPLVRTIVKLITDNGRWEGSLNQLSLAVSETTGEYIDDDPRGFGLKLKEIQPMLLTSDHISITKKNGGRKGRSYCIEPVNRNSFA